MESATHQIYEAAQSPTMEGDVIGTCRTCGVEGVGLLFNKWVKDSFTNWDLLCDGSIVCHACLFSFTEKNDALTKRLSKDKPQKFRSYSHFVVNGVWYPLTKGDKAKMKELLFNEPSVAVIADSGQKHLVFRAKPGWWQFEEQSILPCPALLESILGCVEALYNAGASKDEIASGRYDQRTIMRIGLEIWQALEACVKVDRGSLPFKLAIFLAQREETK